jgi:quercetin dioxygenase-like cupin family protein
MKATKVAAVVLVLCGIAVGVGAQGVPLTILQSGDVSVPGHDGITAVAVFAPSMSTGWHKHPGAMVSYVLEGTVTVEQAGKAAATFTAGQSFIVLADVAHSESNKTDTPARVFVTYIVESGKRLRTEVGPQ